MSTRGTTRAAKITRTALAIAGRALDASGIRRSAIPGVRCVLGERKKAFERERRPAPLDL